MPRRGRTPKPPTTPYTGGGIVPVYRHTLPASAWQLLWWLVTHMDENGKVTGGWRSAAARDIGRHRVWIMRCSVKLAACGLIEAEKGRHAAKVLVQNFVG